MTIHHTKGIVLRSVKYGETSVIVTIYTELFGVQSYMVNGLRSSSRKGSGKANMFQPASLLDMQVYHNDLKNLQRIREFSWDFMYQHIFFDVMKNAAALFMVELLQKTLKQPEANPDLYHFIEDSFIHLDMAKGQAIANFPLFFALHLATMHGFRLNDDFTPDTPYLDLQEGEFTKDHPVHPHFLDLPYSYITSQLLKVMQPQELNEIPLNQETRRKLLQAFQAFYVLHVPDFGTLKTLPVLQEVLS